MAHAKKHIEGLGDAAETAPASETNRCFRLAVPPVSEGTQILFIGRTSS